MTRYFLGLLCVVILLSSCENQDETRKQKFVLKASEAYKNQNYNSAINYLEEAILIDSCYESALNNLGTIYYKQGKLDNALHLYERALTCKPDFYQASINLSNTLYDLKQYYRGLDVLQKQTSVFSDSAGLYFGMGLHLTRLREYDSAVQVFNTSFKLDPENDEVLVNLGTLNYYLKNYPEAKNFLEKAIDRNNNRSEAYNTLALIASAEGEHEQALEYIDEAIAISDEAYFLNNKGYFLLEVGRVDEALVSINESMVIDPLNAWTFRNKAIVRLTQNKPDEAIELLQRAEKLDDWVEDINYYLGKAWLQKNDNDKACNFFRKGADLKENKSIEALNNLCN